PGVRLAIGAFSGFAAAVVLPLAALSGNGQTANLNPPTVALLALVVGYGAAKLLRDLATNIEKLGRVDVEVVEAGIKKACSPRTPVNYSGFVNVRLLARSGSPCVLENGAASLRAGDKYDLVVSLVTSDRMPVEDDALTKLVVIDGGAAAAKVPMTVRVDFG